MYNRKRLNLKIRNITQLILFMSLHSSRIDNETDIYISLYEIVSR